MDQKYEKNSLKLLVLLVYNTLAQGRASLTGNEEDRVGREPSVFPTD